MNASVNCTRPKYVCANERLKLIGTTDGFFPDFGHHLENEMGGLWLYPIKLLDGFWLRFTDHTAGTVDCHIHADRFENYPHKNEFFYNNGLGHTTVTIKRSQIIPEGRLGIIVSYEFFNKGSQVCRCTSRFLARTDLRPVWMAEEKDVYDGAEDTIIHEDPKGYFVAKDCDWPWFAAIGCDTPADDIRSGQFFGPVITEGNGVSVEMTHNFDLAPGETKVLRFYISGSDISRDEAEQEYALLKDEQDAEAVKLEKYEKLFAQSSLKTNDPTFDEIFRWVKVNTDWLIVATSNGNRGIAAGIPEYPWWFGCDSFYTLQGILCMGDYKLCRDTLKLILDYSKKYNGNGRIVHEILTNEVCPNFGNTQETAHFITMIWKYYEWTGDFSLVEEAFDYMCLSIDWLLAQDDDGDYFPTGYGIIEIAGLNMEMIDTAVYTCEAFECFSKICACMGHEAEADHYGQLALKMKDAVNTQLWDEEEGLYCDAYTSYDAVARKMDMIREQLKNAKTKHIREYVERILSERSADGSMERGWLLNRNWVINTPLEIGMAEPDRAERALANMHTPDFIGTYGMYLDALKQDATMTISTGVMAVAQARYGHSDRALELLERIFKSFSMATPGSISEMSPDYGCFVQAWTTYSVMTPIVRHFFGIQPSASADMIVLKPCLPTKWSEGAMAHVRVFDGELSVRYTVENGRLTMTVNNDTGKGVKVCHDGDFLLDGQPNSREALVTAPKFTLSYEI